MGGGSITGREQAAYRLELARGFLEEARQDIDLERWRSAVDGAQLAVENAGKGALALDRRLPTSWEDAASAARGLDGGRVRLEFLTPTFVRFHGRVCVEAPPFAALVQNLLIRIPMLSAVHCGEVWQEDFKALVARAGEVETVTDETTWVSFRRYSSFKKKNETLEGVVGRVEYAGPVEEFLPLLHIGQPTHAGKRAVFGLGRYRLREA